MNLNIYINNPFMTDCLPNQQGYTGTYPMCAKRACNTCMLQCAGWDVPGVPIYNKVMRLNHEDVQHQKSSCIW